jgi:glutamyl-tRNA synthetase
MYWALGWDPPQVAHLSNILGADHKKLSKRTGDTAVRDYKKEGFLPEALLNFFALMAWYPEENREIYSVPELVERFRIADLGKTSPIFDLAKLTWMNGVYMRDLLAKNPDRIAALCLEILQDAGRIPREVTPEMRAYVARVVEVLGERLKVARDILTNGDFFFNETVSYDPDAAQKYFSQNQTAKVLERLRDRVVQAQQFDAAAVETVIRELATELGVESREIIHPVRVALTGKTVGPGLFELMALLGRERVSKRLDGAMSWIRRSAVS